MKIGRQQQQQAANDGHLSTDKAEALYRYLKHQPGKVPNLNFTHILYYLGRLITISAMTLFMNLGWKEFGGWGVLAISMAYAVTGLVKWQWIYLEFGTLIAGAIMAWRYHYPFVVMPIVVTLWYMSMDMEDMLSGGNADYEFKVFVSMWFCLLTTLVAFWVPSAHGIQGITPSGFIC
jgi:hypothetical protein